MGKLLSGCVASCNAHCNTHCNAHCNTNEPHVPVLNSNLRSKCIHSSRRPPSAIAVIMSVYVCTASCVFVCVCVCACLCVCVGDRKQL